MSWDPDELRARLAGARVMLVFTPHLCGEREPLDVLAQVLPCVDLVQVRPKEPDAGLDVAGGAPPRAVTSAREAHDWCVRVLELVGTAAPVLVNDRVDVAAALREVGCAGVHVGADDCPPEVARDVLGPAPLVGLSTHSLRDVGAAPTPPVDYLGFGPVRATDTKGYARGLGADAAWLAAGAAAVPVFAIGGIGAPEAQDLAPRGRVAVGSALLAAPDPARAARELRDLLTTDPDAPS